MATVAVSKEFFSAFSQLPQAQQKKTREFMDRFQANPQSAAIHYEPIKDMRASVHNPGGGQFAPTAFT